MEHLPNGTYPVKETRNNGENYIFILTNDLIVHKEAPHFAGQKIHKYTHNIKINNEDKNTLIIYAGMLMISSSNYKVLHTKEDIIEAMI